MRFPGDVWLSFSTKAALRECPVGMLHTGSLQHLPPGSWQDLIPGWCSITPSSHQINLVLIIPGDRGAPITGIFWTSSHLSPRKMEKLHWNFKILLGKPQAAAQSTGRVFCSRPGFLHTPTFFSNSAEIEESARWVYLDQSLEFSVLKEVLLALLWKAEKKKPVSCCNHNLKLNILWFYNYYPLETIIAALQSGALRRRKKTFPQTDEFGRYPRGI